MSTIVFYGKPECATNARQRALLEAAGHQVIFRNLLAESWTAGRLWEFFGHLPVMEWFNRASPRIKSGEIDPSSQTVESALELLLSDPVLIRRPLMEVGDSRITGFDEEKLRASLSLDAPADALRLQDCMRLPQPHRPRL